MSKAYERTGNVHKLYLDNYAVYTVDYQDPSHTGITYLHTDRLGSIAGMSDSQGQPMADSGRGFDPFGKPREGDWQDSDRGDEQSPFEEDGDLNRPDMTTRGFTGHEHLNGTDLMHMNGRAFDYNLGRFLSVDPIIQFPANSQSINAYSYILNNPLAGTDPSGYSLLLLISPELVLAGIDSEDRITIENALNEENAKVVGAILAAEEASDFVNPVKGLIKRGAKAVIKGAVKKLKDRLRKPKNRKPSSNGNDLQPSKPDGNQKPSEIKQSNDRPNNESSPTEKSPENKESSVDDKPRGRGKNRLRPDSGAEGAHSTFKRDADGNVTNTATFEPNAKNPTGFDEASRTDVKGAPHHNKKTGQDVPTPHVQSKDIPGGVRPAKPEELPKPCVNPEKC